METPIWTQAQRKKLAEQSQRTPFKYWGQDSE
jgi:hypothetical protein